MLSNDSKEKVNNKLLSDIKLETQLSSSESLTEISHDNLEDIQKKNDNSDELIEEEIKIEETIDTSLSESFWNSTPETNQSSIDTINVTSKKTKANKVKKEVKNDFIDDLFSTSSSNKNSFSLDKTLNKNKIKNKSKNKTNKLSKTKLNTNDPKAHPEKGDFDFLDELFDKDKIIIKNKIKNKDNSNQEVNHDFSHSSSDEKINNNKDNDQNHKNSNGENISKDPEVKSDKEITNLGIESETRTLPSNLDQKMKKKMKKRKHEEVEPHNPLKGEDLIDRIFSGKYNPKPIRPMDKFKYESENFSQSNDRFDKRKGNKKDKKWGNRQEVKDEKAPVHESYLDKFLKEQEELKLAEEKEKNALLDKRMSQMKKIKKLEKKKKRKLNST